MRLLAASSLVCLVCLLACGSSNAPQAVDVPPPATTLDVPSIDAGAPPPAPVATNDEPKPDPNPPTDAEPATTDIFDDARDPLFGKRKPRARALVVTELQGLSSLLAATPPTAPDRPAMLKRTGDGYFELARQGGQAATSARQAAIKHYSELNSSYPSFNQRDEVLYYLALSYEKGADYANARRCYYDVIKSYPQSKYIPYAYFAFGEIFRVESASDPSKFDLARQAYKEVMKYPQSPIQPFAKKRLDSLPKP